jgi:phosphate transporter
MFSPVIMLLLGGFAIAAALSKHYIAKAAAASILSRVSHPNHIVLATMFVASFASMWISNVAAPVLCFSLIQPILRRQSFEGQPLGKVCLVLLACQGRVGSLVCLSCLQGIKTYSAVR